MTRQELEAAVREAEAAVKTQNAESLRIHDEIRELVSQTNVLRVKHTASVNASHDLKHEVGRLQHQLNVAIAREVAETLGTVTRDRLLKRLKYDVGSQQFAEAIIDVLEDGARFRRGMRRDDLLTIVVKAENGSERMLTPSQMSRAMVCIEAWCPMHPEVERYLPPYVVEN